MLMMIMMESLTLLRLEMILMVMEFLTGSILIVMEMVVMMFKKLGLKI